jgi:hypothetical protein
MALHTLLVAHDISSHGFHWAADRLVSASMALNAYQADLLADSEI